MARRAMAGRGRVLAGMGGFLEPWRFELFVFGAAALEPRLGLFVFVFGAAALEPRLGLFVFVFDAAVLDVEPEADSRIVIVGFVFVLQHVHYMLCCSRMHLGDWQKGYWENGGVQDFRVNSKAKEKEDYITFNGLLGIPRVNSKAKEKEH